MNKTLVTLGLVGGAAVAAWYFLIPPQISITQIDQLGKKIRFTYNGKDEVFDYSNPALALGFAPVRGFTLEVTSLPGTQPYVSFDTKRGGKMVAQKQIDLNKSVSGSLAV